jgi:hypothetical protein
MPGSAIGGYLVRDYGELVILADAGLGGHPPAGPFELYPLQRSLLATLSVQGVGPPLCQAVVRRPPLSNH